MQRANATCTRPAMEPGLGQPCASTKTATVVGKEELYSGKTNPGASAAGSGRSEARQLVVVSRGTISDWKNVAKSSPLLRRRLHQPGMFYPRHEGIWGDQWSREGASLVGRGLQMKKERKAPLITCSSRHGKAALPSLSRPMYGLRIRMEPMYCLIISVECADAPEIAIFSIRMPFV
jgi:hypothetical protein